MAACSRAEPLITYDGKAFHVEHSGAAPREGWGGVFIVRAGDDASSPPLLGDYSLIGETLTFTPRFAPTPGVKLHALFHPDGGAHDVGADFGSPARPLTPSTRVVHLYPSSPTWPANTLKLYLEFSAPMATNEAYAHLAIKDDHGAIIEKPFVEIDQELWDPSHRRLTVLFDPGRIKRGLIDNEKSGPPLAPGRDVTLVVDPGWRDAAGAPLAEGFKRVIHVSPALREPVRMKDWRLTAPASSVADLVLAFPRPLDNALARRVIRVRRDGQDIAGKVTLEDDEIIWRFTPVIPWAPGRYQVHVEGIIEDLAGNRLGRVFDVDNQNPSEARDALPFEERSFEVK